MYTIYIIYIIQIIHTSVHVCMCVLPCGEDFCTCLAIALSQLNIGSLVDAILSSMCSQAIIDLGNCPGYRH